MPEYWPFPSPGDLPNPAIEHRFPHCRRILYQLNHREAQEAQVQMAKRGADETLGDWHVQVSPPSKAGTGTESRAPDTQRLKWGSQWLDDSSGNWNLSSQFRRRMCGWWIPSWVAPCFHLTSHCAPEVSPGMGRQWAQQPESALNTFCWAWPASSLCPTSTWPGPLLC